MLAREPFVGSSGTVGGNVIVSDTALVSVLDMTIAGSVLVHGGGGEGMEVGKKTRSVARSRSSGPATQPQSPNVFAIHDNIVERNVLVLNNVATGAPEPALRRCEHADRGQPHLCFNNVPDPVNHDVDTTYPNVVLDGPQAASAPSSDLKLSGLVPGTLSGTTSWWAGSSPRMWTTAP